MTLSIALVGTGAAARTHAAAYAEFSQVEVRWVLSGDKARGRRFAEKHGILRHTIRYEDLLTDPRVALVDLCNLPCQHIDFAEKALESGKGVIVEKPFDADLAKAQAFYRIHRTTPLPILVVYQYPYSQTFSKFGEICQHLPYGGLKSYRVDYFTLRDADYYRRWPAVRKKSGGGVLINQGIHFINLVYGMIGYQPMQVIATCANLVHQLAVEDTVFVQTVHENGILGSFHFSTALPSQLQMSFVFDKARIVTGGGKVVIQAAGTTVIQTPGKGDFRHLMAEFTQRLKDDPALHMNLAAAVNDLIIVHAAYRSARSNRPVRLSPKDCANVATLLGGPGNQGNPALPV